MKHLMVETSTENDSDDELDSVDVVVVSTETRSRRHKHKKHKRKKSDEGRKSKSTQESKSKPSTPKISSPEGIKTIKVESESIQSTVQKYVDRFGKGIDSTQNSSPKSSNKKRKSQRRDSESSSALASSEEERWLDAIQSGKLEEVDDELKKIKPKDPKLMTARQRAMLGRKSDKDPEEELMSLPTGYKEVVMTAEAIQRKQIKSQKRKQLADEKREKDKKKTMERLLKKQDSKQLKASRRTSRKQIPQISWRMTTDQSLIIFPPGHPGLPAKTIPEVPKPVICGRTPCKNIKKFTSAKTQTPLCSFECYKLDLAEKGLA